MAQKSAIEWTDMTWNPSTGCSKLSAGCKFCYAEKLAFRLKRMGSKRYENLFDFTMHWDKIEDPLSWKKPRKVFVNSMSDLFHEDADIEFVRQVFLVMQKTPHHQYQVLTKRPERMASWLGLFMEEGDYLPSEHIWLGTSIENETTIDRGDALRSVPAIIRFLSCEPLLGPLKTLDLSAIDWVIVGGESGSHLWKDKFRDRSLSEYKNRVWQAREDKVDWVRDIRDRCAAQNIAFFFKQWGGPTPKVAGRELDGLIWDEYPALPDLLASAE